MATHEQPLCIVAESLLQKTDAAKVDAVYDAFLAKYPDFDSLAVAPVEEIAELLKPLGLFRAERPCQAAQIVVDWGEPHSESQWLKLLGVGKYTARSICANAFGQPLAIDTNVARILERFFGLQGDREIGDLASCLRGKIPTIRAT